MTSQTLKIVPIPLPGWVKLGKFMILFITLVSDTMIKLCIKNLFFYDKIRNIAAFR